MYRPQALKTLKIIVEFSVLLKSLQAQRLTILINTQLMSN